MHRGMCWCWSLGVLTVLGLVMAPAALAHGAAPVRHMSVVRGTLRPVTARSMRVARSHTAIAATATTAAGVRARGARPIPRTSAAAAPRVAAFPRAASHPLSAGTPLLANFNGVGSLNSAVTNFGAEFEPPDQGLCVGNGYVVEMVNSAYTVYRPNGSVVTGPFNVNGPFDEGLREFTSDPRCEYDAATHTWYATILFINAASTASRLDLAVNRSGDPTKPWTDYQIDTTGMGGATGPKDPGCPCFGDQPTLGIDAFNIYITTNEFSIVGPEFNGAQIYAIDKRELTDQPLSPTATPVHFVHFRNLTIGGAVAASVQPALSTGTAPAEYFLNALDPNRTFDQRIGVWAMTNRAAVATGGTPTLASVVLPSEAYGLPPGSDQKGSFSLLDSGDDRMQQTQFINGDIWGELTTSVTIPNDTAARAGAAWFDVHPPKNGLLTNVHMARQGYVTSLGNDVIYPAIQATPSGKAVMGMTFTGAQHYPSTAYSVLSPGAAAFGPITISAAGTGSYDPNATRWGDYAWAVLDPSGKSVWLANEYIPPKASQTTDGATNWGTRVVDVPTG